MKSTLFIQSAAAVFLMVLCPAATGADPRLSIQPGVELSWSTTLGNTYQLQAAPVPTGPWASLTTAMPGDGQPKSHCDFAASGSRRYQVLETVPGIPAPPVNPVNGGFESGSDTTVSQWSVASSQPPTRTGSEAHSGSFAMRCAVVNVGATAAEGLLSQLVVAQGGSITGGQTYNFSFWAKQVSSGPSYLQQYEVQWRNASGGVVGGSGLQNFSGVIGSWTKITVPNLVAPASAVEARVSFRFVTGSVAGGHGEVLIDDVSLSSGSGSNPGTPETVNALPVTSKPVARISWPSKTGVSYRPVATTNFVTWTPLQPLIDGEGGTK